MLTGRSISTQLQRGFIFKRPTQLPRMYERTGCEGGASSFRDSTRITVKHQSPRVKLGVGRGDFRHRRTGRAHRIDGQRGASPGQVLVRGVEQRVSLFLTFV